MWDKLNKMWDKEANAYPWDHPFFSMKSPWEVFERSMKAHFLVMGLEKWKYVISKNSMTLIWDLTFVHDEIYVKLMELHGKTWKFHESPWNSKNLHEKSMKCKKVPWMSMAFVHDSPWKSPWLSMKNSPWTFRTWWWVLVGLRVAKRGASRPFSKKKKGFCQTCSAVFYVLFDWSSARFLVLKKSPWLRRFQKKSMKSMKKSMKSMKKCAQKSPWKFHDFLKSSMKVPWKSPWKFHEGFSVFHESPWKTFCPW